jgi:branched-chain amino acid transport system permease protein
VPVIVTSDLKIHYRQGGQGKQPLVFVHGNYASSRWWVPQLERLPEGARGYALDLRGVGGSRASPPRRELTIGDLASDLGQFLDALRLNDPILVGHSLGGVIVTEYALRRPNTTRGLVLVDTGPPNGLPLAALAEPFALPFKLKSRALMQTALRQAGAPHRGRLAKELVDDALATDPDQYVAFSRAVADWNVEAQLPRLRVPSLLVWGKGDRLLPPRIGRRYLELLPQARLVTLPGAGHSPHVEQPDEFAAVLGDFLTRLTARVERVPGKPRSLLERLLVGRR